MDIILFGGAFDPIHNAHLTIAKKVMDKTGFDRFYFVPTYKSNFGKKMIDVELMFKNMRTPYAIV